MPSRLTLRLDNRKELRDQLGASREASDADLMLRAYERGAWTRHSIWWAFRVCHLGCARQRGRARDMAGQRTLFYRAHAHTFAAASEIHQLLQDPSVPLAPERGAIRSAVPANMQRNAQEQARTYYAGISSLLPGHQLVVTREALQVLQLRAVRAAGSIRYKRTEEYVEHFRELFFTAVAQRLPTDSHLGALLSGGLDSASIVCAAQELYRAGTVVGRGLHDFQRGV